MNKKLTVFIAIVALFAATGFGVYLASNQAAQPTNDLPTLTTATKLTVTEINKTTTVPNELGKVHYIAKNPTSLLFFSSRYEVLDCADKPIAELQLTSKKITDTDITIDDSHQFGHIVLHPLGECADPAAGPLEAAAATMLSL